MKTMPNRLDKSEKFLEFLIYLYFALTFFEPYLNGVLGSVTKYYILFVMFVIILRNGFRIKLRSYIVPFVIWLGYCFVTLLWTDTLYMFRVHVFSQIGMVGLLMVLTMQPYSKKVVDNIIKVMWLSSFTISFLAMIFGQSYHGFVETRQVLVLFGQEIDPNNQAAFALVGISIALYYIFYEKKYFIISFVILFVNSISMFKTGSRGGFVSMLAILIFIIGFNEKNRGILVILKKYFFLICIIFVVFLTLKNYIPEDTLERLINVESYEGGSERTLLWENAAVLLQENLNFIFGAGWGAYYGYNGFRTSLHNTYLTMLCDVGIIGVIIFFTPIIKKALYCIKEKEYLPVLLLIAGFCPCFFIDAINKRIFWNAIMFLFIFVINYKQRESESLHETNSVDK